MAYTSLNDSTTDTHGMSGRGWYGFDLDGTLATYNGWQGIDHIGEPIKPMVERIKRLHDEGNIVKIMTARVAPKEETETRPNPYFTDGVPDYVRRNASTLKYLYYSRFWTAKIFIMDWCLKNLGFIPEITHKKDGMMIELYDDRVKQVIPNMGILVEDIATFSSGPRNCDIGTVEEQSNRFNKFCHAHKELVLSEYRCSDDCPCLKTLSNTDCAIVWSNMPYSESGL